MGSYISLFKPLLLCTKSRYSFCLSHYSGALPRIWNRIDFISCLFSLQCFVMGPCLSEHELSGGVVPASMEVPILLYLYKFITYK